MIDDMSLRNLSPATQRSHLHAVTKFSRYFGRSPDCLGLEQTRRSALAHHDHPTPQMGA
jgi:integrase/recombinase XerD